MSEHPTNPTPVAHDYRVVETQAAHLAPAAMNGAKTGSGIADFDFLIGGWRVQHRRLKRRLQGSSDWETFGGSSRVWKLMDGQGNVEDNLLEFPDGHYRAVALRAFDTQTQRWSIWWLDGRTPGQIDVPVQGGFAKGVGIFLADDTYNGQPIRVRFTWSEITPDSAKWQQAFSDDGGSTWETNWTMEFQRNS